MMMMTSINDYIASSNNSINENKLNAKKDRSKMHQLKMLLKPFAALVKKNRKNTYCKVAQPEFYVDECADNAANEALEARICNEIDVVPDFAGVPVFSSEGELNILPVSRGQHYIPVHFAKTSAGTFFWTSVIGADNDLYCNEQSFISEHQTPELQVPCTDRWAQA